MNMRIQRLSLLTLVAFLAIAVLTLSYPRLSSSLRYIPVETALKRNWGDYPIKLDQYPALINITKGAIRKLDAARYWQGLGWLHYLYAMALDPGTPEGFKSLGLSQLAYENFLKKSPVKPAEWLRLAWVHRFLGHDGSKTARALKMSFYTGRAEQYLIFDRLSLALSYETYFEKEDLGLIRDQIQLAWRFNEHKLLELMREGTYDPQILLGLIAETNPELTKEIEEKL